MAAIVRVNDPHSCPASTPFPHGGGVVQGPGSSVVVGYQPAATELAPCSCGGGGPNAIMPGSGSPSVFIDYLPAARTGSKTLHGGTVIATQASVTLP